MIIGHAKQLDFLRKSWEEKRIGHAYLFVGPHGVGKRRVAAELVGWILGKAEAPADLSQEFEIRYVEREPDKKTGKKHKDISIEQIHAARNYLAHHSFLNSHKLVIIDEAEFLSRAAGNALLKTLEEPSLRTTIILLTDDEKKLLPTIVSRCQLLQFPPVPTGEIAAALRKMGAQNEEAEELARLSHHRPGRALQLLKE
jgi:DNA polymerase-3 subunit delta'